MRSRSGPPLPVFETTRRRHRSPRPAWRQRLVIAERGLGQGMRQDSIFFVHGFSACLIVMTGLVFGLNATAWAILTVAITMLFATELLHQALRSWANTLPQPLPAGIQQALGMAMAAVMCTAIGVVIVSVILFVQRWSEVF